MRVNVIAADCPSNKDSGKTLKSKGLSSASIKAGTKFRNIPAPPLEISISIFSALLQNKNKKRNMQKNGLIFIIGKRTFPVLFAFPLT
ncbi:hypothetical protein [Leptospira ellisii]|uniref:hypothetical protein n=1 Tax=Leptospira ellisii TaxID=2023197 RepID=UPI000F6390C1|nr:hypothetical protein [Leptospira ellisii]